ncbi:MAG: hypothetical protein IJ867_06945 [Clostridia bacterium]|nr:hypothetical protein [Clostridia bacterium]
MNLDSAKYLYQQLKNMELDNKREKRVPILKEYAFLALTDAQKLMYLFWYRDTQTLFLNEEGEQEEEYIELPSMDLSGQDLSRVRLSKEITGLEDDLIGLKMRQFIPATHDEEGKLVLSNINLHNTNAQINLNNALPTSVSFNELRAKRLIVDFSHVDFRGCKLYGILPDEYLPEDTGRERMKTRFQVIGRENLDETYLQRRNDLALSPQDKKLADTTYHKLMNGEIINPSRWKKKVILCDYDFSSASPRVISRIKNLAYNLNVEYTGVPEEELGYETFQFLTGKRKTELLSRKLKGQEFPFIARNLKYTDITYIHKVFEYLILMGQCDNLELSDGDRQEILAVFQSCVEKIRDDDFYRFYHMAIDEHNYDFMEANYARFYKIINMEAYRNKNYEKIEKVIDTLKQREKKSEISSIEKDKIKHFIDPIVEKIEAEKLAKQQKLEASLLPPIITTSPQMQEYLEKEREINQRYENSKLVAKTIIENFTSSNLDQVVKDLKEKYGEEMVDKNYAKISQNWQTLSSFLQNRFHAENTEGYIRRLCKNTNYLTISTADDDFKFEQLKYSLDIKANIFDVFHQAKNIFLIEENDPDEERKIEVYGQSVETLYGRLMFFQQYQDKFHFNMKNPKFIWNLAMPSREFVNIYLRKVYPKKEQTLWSREHDHVYTEFSLLDEYFRMPTKLEEVFQNIKQVKKGARTLKGETRE